MQSTKPLKLLAAGAAALLSVTAGVTAAQAQDGESYLLATASTGGTYYPVGVALATLVKIKLEPSNNIGMSAISSAGSGENIALLDDNEVQFGILQGLFGAYAAQGSGPLAEGGPRENLRSITMLWPNVEHFVAKADSGGTGTIDDLAGFKGQKASMGAQNSGTIASSRTIVNNLGFDMDADFDLAYMGYGPSAEALQNGQIELMSTPAGPPVSAVTQAFANMGDSIRILEFTDEQIAKANGDFEDLWTKWVLPAGTYPGQDADVTTIAQPNFLAVRDDVPEETVYLITKTIFENLPFLQGIHGATKEMSLDTAMAGLPLKLHPGAVRYYEEAGLTVPDRLK
jgi:TRAP transporter TAXI family solute receptor